MSLTLPKPSPATVAAITEPWYARRSTWAAVAAILTELPNFLNLWAPLLSVKQAMALHALAVTLATVTALLARIGGVNAAGRVAEIAAPTPDLSGVPPEAR